jgi:hypothetical protein
MKTMNKVQSKLDTAKATKSFPVPKVSPKPIAIPMQKKHATGTITNPAGKAMPAHAVARGLTKPKKGKAQ